MAKLLTSLRLPALVLGLALLFVAERYLGTETYHMALRVTALALVALSVLMTLSLSSSAARAGLAGEASGWRRLVPWQAAVLAAMGLYLGYVKSLGTTASPETPVAKVLLAAWLLCLVLGVAAGIGGEWAMRTTGRGELAEPTRVSRATYSWLSIGVLFGVLVCFNFVGDKKDKSSDWSYLKVRTPSESTQKMLKTLTGDLKINLYFPPDNEVRGVIADYFESLAQKEPHIKLAWYDKDMSPTQAETDRVSRNGQIVLDMGGKKSRIDTGIQLSKAKKTLKELDSEFQKAFLETTAARKTLYFTRGHGEYSWVGESADNPLKSLRLLEGFLRQQNYSTRLFGIAEGSATAVPDDASAVVIVGPTEPFQKEEVDALRAYVEKGGNLMVFMTTEKPTARLDAPLDPAAGANGGQPLLDLLAETGLTYNDTPLGNEKNHVAATHSDSDVWFIFSNIFTSHESVATLARHDERVALLVYRSGSFTVKADTAKFKMYETARTLSDTFQDANRNFKFDPGEKRDSFVLGAAGQLRNPPKDPSAKDPKAGETRRGRVVAFADATAISDALVRNIGNALYFADSVKWLVGQSDLQGELGNEEDVKIRHTRKEDVVWFQGTVVVVPLLVLGAGFLATRRRRRTDRDGKGKEMKDAA